MFSVIGNVIVLNIYSKDIRIENDMPKWVYIFKQFHYNFIYNFIFIYLA